MLLFVHIFCSVLRIRSCCLYPFCWCKCSGSCRVCLCVCVRACALSLSHFFFFYQCLRYDSITGNDSITGTSHAISGFRHRVLTDWRLGFFLMWVSLDLWKAQTSVHFLLPLPPGFPLLHHTTTHLFLFYIYILYAQVASLGIDAGIDARDSRSVDIYPQYRVIQFALINFVWRLQSGD